VHICGHQPPARWPASTAPKAQRSARNPGSGRFNLPLAALLATLGAGVAPGCRRAAESEASAAPPSLLWPADVPIEAECLAAQGEQEPQWHITSPGEQADVVVLRGDGEPDSQPLDDLLVKTVLLVGLPAPEQPPLAGTFAQLGFVEAAASDAAEMRRLLVHLAVDLVVVCSPEAAERSALASALSRHEPPVRFTTYQPERGQADLAARARDLLGPPERAPRGPAPSSPLLRDDRGQVVGVGRASAAGGEEARYLGIHRRVAGRAAREAALAAIRCWAETPR